MYLFYVMHKNRGKITGMSAEVNSQLTIHRMRGRRYNPLGEKGARAIVDVVKYDLPLRELKLGWCKVGDKGGAQALGELLQFNETLEVLLALLSGSHLTPCDL